MWEPTAQSSNPGKDKQEQDSQIDSGFLSSDQILSGYSEEGDHQQPQSSNDLGAKPSNTDTDDKLHSTYLDSGLVEDVEVSNSEMLLERELDHGLAEWLCNLDLKNSAAAVPSQINNLGRKGENTKASKDQLNISDDESTCAGKKRQKSSSSREESSSSYVEMPEEEQPWEMCYKQDADGDTYLHLAVSESAEEIVRDLIKITPHPCLLDIQNDSLQSSLHLAVLVANVRIVRMLLLAGAESSTRDKYGNTPLHLACAAGDLDCVRALTERITATEEENAISCTGVLVASSKSSSGASAQKVTKLSRTHMVQYADVELRNYDGERCVHIAAAVTGTEQKKHVDVMRELVVRSGADVNAREGKAGYTALHMAVERGDKDLVKFLLDECSSLNLEVASYGRWTAYQIATVNRNQELMSLLRKKGAEALNVSSSEESEDSDVDDNEILELYGPGFPYSDRTLPCVVVGY